MSTATVGIRLGSDMQARLKVLGNRRDRSPHYLMKEAVEIYLKREEQIEAEKTLLRTRWEKFEFTGETVSHDDVKAWAKNLPQSSAT